jgi:uroporphyrin-III C-methyltransferase/precorrin-2 dehydrogenase/sirohydrochlorin ferrochelatase
MSECARPPLFPIFLDLTGRRAVVIGGGEVATRKVQALLAAGAEVRVIAPAFAPALQEVEGNAQLQLVRRSYTRGDLAGCVLAFAATDDPAVNAAVHEEATAAAVPVNVADDPAHCCFYVPAQIARGPICIAISTQGDSPALARHLRERIEETVPSAYGELAELLGRLREEVKATVPASERGQRWNEVVACEELRARLAQGRREEAEALARRLLGLAEEGTR